MKKFLEDGHHMKNMCNIMSFLPNTFNAMIMMTLSSYIMIFLSELLGDK